MNARVERAGERAAQAARERIAAAIAQTVPGVGTEVIDEGVSISGRGLARRVLSDPRLRVIAAWLR